MGALPDREPPVGAPTRSPDQAPPLFAVPRRPATAPEPARENTPTTTPAPEHTPPAQEHEPEVEDTDDVEDSDRAERLRAWVQDHLAGLDVWAKPIPPLSTVWAQALAGDHLPTSPVWRVAEIARLVVSLPLSAAAYLACFALVSAPRTAGLCVVVIAAWTVVSTLVSAAINLF